jgi:hypothetical protein
LVAAVVGLELSISNAAVTIVPSTNLSLGAILADRGGRIQGNALLLRPMVQTHKEQDLVQRRKCLGSDQNGKKRGPAPLRWGQCPESIAPTPVFLRWLDLGAIKGRRSASKGPICVKTALAARWPQSLTSLAQGVTKAVRLPSWSGRWFWGARLHRRRATGAGFGLLYFDWRTCARWACSPGPIDLRHCGLEVMSRLSSEVSLCGLTGLTKKTKKKPGSLPMLVGIQPTPLFPCSHVPIRD